MDWIIVVTLFLLYGWIMERNKRMSMGAAILMLVGGGAMFAFTFVALLMSAVTL